MGDYEKGLIRGDTRSLGNSSSEDADYHAQLNVANAIKKLAIVFPGPSGLLVVA